MMIRRPRPAKGFTLIEMLVVVGIIVVLLGILVPTIYAIQRQSQRKRIALDLQAISMALEAYKSDCGDYPRPPVNARGNKVLSWALLGPFPATSGDMYHDGADGLGFRKVWDASTNTGGQVFGPYLPADRFKLDTTVQPPAILDMFQQRIEYFPRWRNFAPNMNLFNSYTPPGGTAGPGLYDEQQKYDGNVIQPLRKLLGDVSNNDKIDANERLTTAAPFLLISRGPRKTDWKDPVSNIDQ